MSASELIPLSSMDIQVAADAERARFAPVMKIEYALERRKVIKQAFSELMNDGEDYGKVAGIGKPTLLQPGAQKLDNLFGLVPRFPVELMRIEEDWTGERHGGEPFFRYMVVCQLMRGEFVMGEAIGECNSWESKYRYRNAERVCPSCGKGAIIQTKHKSGPNEGKPKNFWCAPFKGGCSKGFTLEDPAVTKQETGKRPNPDICDQVNTFLKMAQKRAHVGATINATSASEFFSQDMEPQTDAPEPAAAETEPDTRPVPEELSLLFKRIDDKDNRAIKEIFAVLEKDCVAVAGTHGLDEFKRLTGELRTKYPKGGLIPISELKRCMLDVWDLIDRARGMDQERAEVAGGISDEDVPF